MIFFLLSILLSPYRQHISYILQDDLLKICPYRKKTDVSDTSKILK